MDGVEGLSYLWEKGKEGKQEGRGEGEGKTSGCLTLLVRGHRLSSGAPLLVGRRAGGETAQVRLVCWLIPSGSGREGGGASLVGRCYQLVCHCRCHITEGFPVFWGFPNRAASLPACPGNLGQPGKVWPAREVERHCRMGVYQLAGTTWRPFQETVNPWCPVVNLPGGWKPRGCGRVSAALLVLSYWLFVSMHGA